MAFVEKIAKNKKDRIFLESFFLSEVRNMDDQTIINQVAILEPFITPHKKEKIKQVLANRTNFITILLEDILQPHNASAVLRSADCFGVQNVHVIEDKHSFKPITTIDRGSSKWLTLHKYKKAKNAIDILKKQNYKIIATTPDPSAISLPSFEVRDKLCLVFGTEWTGISDYVKAHADGFLTIPMFGFTESFNISVSVSIVLFDLVNKLHNTDIGWQLTSEEKMVLTLEWYKQIVKASEQILNRYAEDTL